MEFGHRQVGHKREKAGNEIVVILVGVGEVQTVDGGDSKLALRPQTGQFPCQEVQRIPSGKRIRSGMRAEVDQHGRAVTANKECGVSHPDIQELDPQGVTERKLRAANDPQQIASRHSRDRGLCGRRESGRSDPRSGTTEERSQRRGSRRVDPSNTTRQLQVPVPFLPP